MRTAIEVFGLLMALGSFLPLLRTTNHWVRMLDFPRLQLAFFLLLSLLAHGLLGFTPQPFAGCWLGILVLALLLQIRAILPFTVFARPLAKRCQQAEQRRTFSLMIANVRMDNDEKAAFVELIRTVDPDVLLVNEPDEAWAAHLRKIEPSYPHSVQKPLPNTYGMMLFSKLPLHHSRVLYRVEEGIPSIVTEVELPDGQRFNFYGLHPQPPTHSNDTEKREAELLMVGKEVKQSGKASIVAGDLNDVGWSYTTSLFKKISGTLDPRVGRGFFSTYNVFVPFFRYPLDHVFYTPHFQLVHMRRLSAFGSDHFPILIQLTFAPEVSYVQEVTHAEPEEKQEANELIQEGLASESATRD